MTDGLPRSPLIACAPPRKGCLPLPPAVPLLPAGRLIAASPRCTQAHGGGAGLIAGRSRNQDLECTCGSAAEMSREASVPSLPPSASRLPLLSAPSRADGGGATDGASRNAGVPLPAGRPPGRQRPPRGGRLSICPVDPISPAAQPLGDPASAQLLREPALAGLFEGVSEPLRSQLASLPQGLADVYYKMEVDMARIDRLLPHTLMGHLALAVACFMRTGCVVPLPLVPRKPFDPSAPQRPSIVFLGHFPSELSELIGYVMKNGHAGDPTTRFVENGVWHNTGFAEVFGDQFDIAADSFPAPTDNYVGGDRRTPFNVRVHFLNRLSRRERAEWTEVHVEALAGRFVDEILTHGRREGRVVLCGRLAGEVMWPIAVEAANRARSSTGLPYLLHHPPVPPGTANIWLEHACTALRALMPLESRRRWDDALRWVYRGLAGVRTSASGFFEEHSRAVSCMTSEHVRELQLEEIARRGHYRGRCHWRYKLTADEQHHFDEALRIELRRRAKKGVVTLAQRSGYIGADDPRDAAEQQSFRAAVTAGCIDRLVMAVPDYEGEFARQGPIPTTAAYSRAVTQARRSALAVTGGHTGPALRMAEAPSPTRAKAIRKGARHAAMAPRKKRRSDARLASHTGPGKKGEAKLYHKCKMCGAKFGTKKYESDGKTPHFVNAPRHTNCPAADNKTRTSLCVGGKGGKHKPKCFGCWPSSEDDEDDGSES